MSGKKMNIKNLEEFIKLAKNEGVSELKYESGDEEYYVKLPTSAESIVYSSPVTTKTTHASMPVEKSTKSSGNFKEVTSPFVGTFYRSASPESEPYAKVGDRVGQGQVLCIVEAMKIMNEIESEYGGEIAEICVENETYVEFGQVLFKIKP